MLNRKSPEKYWLTVSSVGTTRAFQGASKITSDLVPCFTLTKEKAMSPLVRRMIAIASLVAVLTATGVASANPTHSVIDRRQHPNVGYFKHTTTHHHHHASMPLLRRLFR